MKKLFLVFLTTLSLMFSSAQADLLLSTSAYVADQDNANGVLVSLSGGNKILYKGDLAFSNNFGGVGIALGYKIKEVELYVGSSLLLKMPTQNGYVDVQGVPVFDPSADVHGSTLFLELRYKNMFIRHSNYDLDYRLRGSRLIPMDTDPVSYMRVSDSKVETLSGSVIWLGFVIPF